MPAMPKTVPSPQERRDRILGRQSVIEKRARERARAILDPGSFRELLGPFERMESPWLPMQGVVPESDDGVIIARGLLAGTHAVVLAIEGAFQGGSLGEVSGTKIAAALALARRDCEDGKPILPVLLLETGGVRLQEANLGEAIVAEIHAEIVALRRLVPVIGVVTGMVGCFGGMSIAAGLCSYLVVLPQGRLELNGPEVIEEQAGIEELDARDRRLIWSLMGGAHATRPVSPTCSSRTMPSCSVKPCKLWQPVAFLPDTGPKRSTSTRDAWPGSIRQRRRMALPCDGFGRKESNHDSADGSRGRTWFAALAGGAEPIPTGLESVLVADAVLGGELVRLLALVPDPANRFPRARHGELGLDEGWCGPAMSGKRWRPIAPAETPDHRHRRRQEPGLRPAGIAAGHPPVLGRGRRCLRRGALAGHPSVALVVGAAISGDSLRTVGQAHRLLALDAPGVVVHAMAREAAARVPPALRRGPQ